MIEWTEELSVGLEMIDQEHREIIKGFNSLYTKMRQGKGHDYYQDFLTFLETYVETHFAHEEAYQEEIMYPDIEEHIKLHCAFKERVMHLCNSNVSSVTDIELIKLNLFVKDWLINHILSQDKALGDYARRLNGEF